MKGHESRLGRVYHGLRQKLVKDRMRGESFQRWIARNMDNSLLAAILDIFQITLGLVVTLLYFNKNWYGWDTSMDSPTLRIIHACFGFNFAYDYLLRLYAADNIETYIFSPLAIIEFFTIAPQFVEVVFSEDDNRYNYLLFAALKCLRPFRCLRCFRLLAFAKTARIRETGMLFFSVCAIIVCFAAVQQAFEACPCMSGIEPSNCSLLDRNTTSGRCQDMQIYNAMYFVVITIATLGYGDIAPKSPYGRVIVILLITASTVLLPLEISTLSDVLNRETEYDKAYTARKEQGPHVLICGEVTSGALDFFLRQFLHPNNLNWKDKVVILCPSIPSHNLKRVLLNAAYEQRVVYLQGSAMLDADLKRASAATARLCFIMTHQQSQDVDRSDTSSNFITISLRRYNKSLPIFVQVLKTDNIRHVHLSGANNIVCLDQLKLGILARSCVMPGVSAFVCSILFAFRPFRGAEHSSWASEFLRGCSNDIYDVRIPQYLDGLVTFSMFAYVLFQEFGIVPIGMSHGDEYRLFPSSTRIHCDYTIYVLSMSPDCSRRIDALSLTQLQKYHTLLDNFHTIAHAWNQHSFTGKLASRVKSSSRRLLQRTRGSLVYSSFFSTKSVERREEPILSARSETEHSVHKSSLVVPCEADACSPTFDPTHMFVPLPQVAEVPVDTTKPTLEPLQRLNPTYPIGRLPPIQVASRVEVPTTRPSRSTSQLSVDFISFLTRAVPDDLKDHIVLCGMPNMLHDFIAPLRQLRTVKGHSSHTVSGTLHLGNVPVVVVSATPISEKQHASIATFQHVYYIHGSPLLLNVLAAARTARSKSVVILSSASSETPEDEPDIVDENMIDTDALTLYRFVTEFCETSRHPDMPLPTILLVLNRPSSLRFVKDEHDIVPDDDETLESIQRFKRQVLSRTDDPLDSICTPIYASGKVFFPNALDALLGTCDKYGSVIDLIYLFILGEPPRGDDHGRTLDQIAIPPTLWGRPYGACFETMLLQHNVLCIGIYRSRAKQNSFVYVNPSADVFLQPKDLLFVLR
ncbi:Voltage-gated Ion Channel (VIC) Superfamily [Achlya hypogyna]|uniref:BK channel n=1 Tax=Achlya hypogyna TaxID=1202772 RepID=A0A1V9ZF50_ACHHY|nr:Voltage-gated Ion Channel (VIC) Superfamily [Achlya hypogyna]